MIQFFFILFYSVCSTTKNSVVFVSITFTFTLQDLLSWANRRLNSIFDMLLLLS